MKLWIESIKQGYRRLKRHPVQLAHAGGAGTRYLDELASAQARLGLWRSVASWMACAFIPLVVLIAGLTIWSVTKADKTQFILSPAVQRFEIVTPNEVPNSYIKAAFEHIAERNSSWTFESIEENYQDLFQNYYSGDLTTRTKANLEQTGRFEQVRQNRMVSTFKVDRDKSDYAWCGTLGLACGLVAGKEIVFVDGNQPFRSEDVAYLIFADSIMPTRINPFALRVTRLIVGNYDSLRKTLAAAKKGELSNDVTTH